LSTSKTRLGANVTNSTLGGSKHQPNEEETELMKCLLTRKVRIYQRICFSLQKKDKSVKMYCFVFPSVMVTVDTFLKELDAVNTSLLLGIQKLAKIAESRSSECTQEQETADSGRRNRHCINSFSSP